MYIYIHTLSFIHSFILSLVLPFGRYETSHNRTNKFKQNKKIANLTKSDLHNQNRAHKKNTPKPQYNFEHLKYKSYSMDKKPTIYHFLFLLYKMLNMFRATMCQSSGADDCVVLSPRVGIVL